MIHWIQPEDVARARERWKPFFEKLAASPMNVLNENANETVDVNLARWKERFQRIMETEELAE